MRSMTKRGNYFSQAASRFRRSIVSAAIVAGRSRRSTLDTQLLTYLPNYNFAPSLPVGSNEAGEMYECRGLTRRELQESPGDRQQRPGFLMPGLQPDNDKITSVACSCLMRKRRVSASDFSKSGRARFRPPSRDFPASSCFCRRRSKKRWISRRISKSGVNSSARSAGAETSLIAPISRSPWLIEPLLRVRRGSMSAKLSGWGDANTIHRERPPTWAPPAGRPLSHLVFSLRRGHCFSEEGRRRRSPSAVAGPMA